MEEKGYLAYRLQFIMEGSHCRNTEARTTVDWFASRLMFSNLSYTTQNQQPREWYHLQWAGPSYIN